MNLPSCRNAILFTLAMIIAVIPWVMFESFVPSKTEIEKEKCVKGGVVSCANGNILSIYLVWGDVFKPKEVYNDIGFDLVAISCFFDPVKVVGKYVLPLNPMLYSALRLSSKNPEERVFFLENIVASLNKSRTIINKIANKRDFKDTGGEGDQIVPFIWPVFPKSETQAIEGIKYFCTIPLFDPTLVVGDMPEHVIRERLRLNLTIGIHRLVDLCSEDLDPTVHSVALPFLGSTSHRGGDSRYFLEFADGVLAIIKGLENARPTNRIDRVYLVAFNKHEKEFKEDALGALVEARRYLLLREISSGNKTSIIGIILALLFFVYGFLLYRNQDYFRNNLALAATVLALTPVAVSIVWVAPLCLFGEGLFAVKVSLFWLLYLILCVLVLSGMALLGKAGKKI